MEARQDSSVPATKIVPTRGSLIAKLADGAIVIAALAVTVTYGASWLRPQPPAIAPPGYVAGDQLPNIPGYDLSQARLSLTP